MRALVQRTTGASVSIKGVRMGEISHGLVVLVCAMQGDEARHVAKLASKVAKLRIFEDEEGKMNHSLLDVGGEALVISQFTLAAETKSGNRPGFSTAAPSERGKELYLDFINQMQRLNVTVAAGEFGADMQVSLVNDGPITIWLEV